MNQTAKRFTEPKHNGSRRKCPHCRKHARIATSEEQSPLSRKTWYQCTNINCGLTWVEASMALHMISPSACPDPNVYLPYREDKK